MITIEQIEDLIESLTINDIKIKYDCVIHITNMNLIKEKLKISNFYDVNYYCAYDTYIPHQTFVLDYNCYINNTKINNRVVFYLKDNLVRHKFSALRYELEEKQYYENLIELCNESYSSTLKGLL